LKKGTARTVTKKPWLYTYNTQINILHSSAQIYHSDLPTYNFPAYTINECVAMSSDA